MLFWKECKKTVCSLLYAVYVIAVVAVYVTQFVPHLEEPVTEPLPGQEDYGTIIKEVPEILMERASAGLWEEYLQGSYTAYPMGFYRKVSLTEEKEEQMEEILSEITGNDVTYERFRELMRQADKLIGGDSRYGDHYIVQFFSSVPKTYEDALSEYRLFIGEDKVTEGYARIFSDYFGCTVAAVLPAFLAAALWLGDRRAKMNELIWGRSISSAGLVLARFLAVNFLAVLPMLVLAGAATLQVRNLYPGCGLDWSAFFRYTGFWLFPEILTATAVSMLLTCLTDSPAGILVQSVWWMSVMTGEAGRLTGSIGRFDLIPRHNSVMEAEVFRSSMGNLIFNRIFYVLLSIGLTLITILIYEQKRRGRAFGIQRSKKIMRRKSEI